ncbi:MAG TPA: hypothetical protein VI653_29060 [Steroidobacteraceae bacterium]
MRLVRATWTLGVSFVLGLGRPACMFVRLDAGQLPLAGSLRPGAADGRYEHRAQAQIGAAGPRGGNFLFTAFSVSA